MPFKDKEKAKEYFKNYNKNRPVIREHKCELCTYKFANVLETIDDKFVLCPNHLIEFIMRNLSKENTKLLLDKHGRTVYLDYDFYDDDGTSLQPI